MNRAIRSLGRLPREAVAAIGLVKLHACRRRIALGKGELCLDQTERE